MRHHYVGVSGRLAAGAAIFLLALVPLDGQTPTAGRQAPPASPGTFMTPWGDPDLQGTWTNQTLTPLERPAEFAGKPVLSEVEAAEYEARRQQETDADIRTPGTPRDVTVAYNDFWWDRGERIVADRRTSLIIDPGGRTNTAADAGRPGGEPRLEGKPPRGNRTPQPRGRISPSTPAASSGQRCQGCPPGTTTITRSSRLQAT